MSKKFPPEIPRFQDLPPALHTDDPGEDLVPPERPLDLCLGVPDQIVPLRAHPADAVHHILPAVMPYIAKQAVSIFSASILSEASLSFLGCGVPVTIPTLGSMLSEARPVMGQAPWLVAFPALFLFLIGLSLDLLASGRSELDPSSH